MKTNAIQPEIAGYKSIYAVNYFDLASNDYQLLSHKDAYIITHLSSDTMEHMAEILGFTESEQAEYADRIKQSMGLTQDFNLSTSVIRLDYPYYTSGDSTELLSEIAQQLRDNAIRILTNASGDDEFFDYAPGAADCCIELLEKLGRTDLAQEIKDFLQSNGHND